MDKKLTKYMKIWSPQNKQTYPIAQTVADNTIKHNKTQTYLITGERLLAVNTEITTLYTLIGIRY